MSPAASLPSSASRVRHRPSASRAVPSGAAPLFHLALSDEWAAARDAGVYDRSTVGRSLAEERFIHCSFAEQVRGTADRYYRGRDDVVADHQISQREPGRDGAISRR